MHASGCYVLQIEVGGYARTGTHDKSHGSLEFHEAGRYSDVGETTPRMFWFWVLGLGPLEVSSRPVLSCPALPCHKWPPWLAGVSNWPQAFGALLIIPHWTIQYSTVPPACTTHKG
jgi:hypothetical protein